MEKTGGLWYSALPGGSAATSTTCDLATPRELEAVQWYRPELRAGLARTKCSVSPSGTAPSCVTQGF